ncbi:MAG: MoxR family ATPase [Anaerolineales bacterium]|nr:MoxR family ATPase [Anaerolineales bacterium]
MKSVQEFSGNLIANIEQVIVGKRAAIELAVIGLLCQGHLLIEDIPGVGKTMLARSLARSLDCSFSRIQFTPDMLPSDITGVAIFNQAKETFEYRPGPILAQIVLADEINRATPKTQSALLEAMQEQQVTVDGVSHRLPEPFMVLATQNPIEYEGTYRLPEAQLDRFLLRIRLGYPEMQAEIDVLDRQQFTHPLDSLHPVTSTEEVRAMQRAIQEVFISAELKQYLVEIVRRSRTHPDVYLGASPRGSLALYRASQARAAIQGRDYVLPDDIKALAVPALAHRLILGPGARLRNLTPETVIQGVFGDLLVPGGDPRAR